MNHRAQIPVLSLAFALIVFFILWAMFFARWLQDNAEQAISTNNLTGLEAFFLAYINVWVLCGVILGSLAFLYFGGGQR